MLRVSKLILLIAALAGGLCAQLTVTGDYDSNPQLCMYGCVNLGGNWTITTAHAQDLVLFTAPKNMTLTKCNVFIATASAGSGVACGITTLTGTILGQCAISTAATGPGTCTLSSPISLVNGTAYYQIASADTTAPALNGGISNTIILIGVNSATQTNGNYLFGRANTSSTGTGSGLTLVAFASVTTPAGGYSGSVFPALFTK